MRQPTSTSAPKTVPQPPRSLRGDAALPDLRALETFTVVCEAGSMSLAAQRLGITQSAVSQTIQVLEAGYGLQLFDREVRPARPTRAGNLLLEKAAELLSGARLIAEQLRSSVRQEHAQLRLGCVDSFAATVGPELVRALSGATRQLQLWSGLTPGLNQQLLARELDLAICTEVPLEDKRISQRLLFSERWVAVFARGTAPAAPDSLRALKTLAVELPLIRYTQRSVIGQQVERFLRHVGINLPRRFEFDATDPMLSLVSAGLGWAITTPLCLWQSRAWLDTLDLVPIAPIAQTHLSGRDFYLLCREAEWAPMAHDIVRLTQSVLERETLPAMRLRMPALPNDAILLNAPLPMEPRP